MFERFTDRARSVVVLAQEEARMLNHNYVGTEHILLGLVHEGEGVAAKSLESLGISLDAVRQQIKQIIGQGQDAPSGHIPLTPRAKKVLEMSLREAKQLGHSYIGTEHILLGLVREGEGVAAQVLVKLGADLGRVRQAVVQLLHGDQGFEPESGAPSRRGRRAARADEMMVRLDSIARRLAAIERRLGIGEQPAAPELGEYDEQIARVRREKESAIDARDMPTAAALRDREKQLLTERAARQRELKAVSERAASELNVGTVAGETERLRTEVSRLQALLRQHGIEPGDRPHHLPGQSPDPGGPSHPNATEGDQS